MVNDKKCWLKLIFSSLDNLWLKENKKLYLSIKEFIWDVKGWLPSIFVKGWVVVNFSLLVIVCEEVELFSLVLDTEVESVFIFSIIKG